MMAVAGQLLLVLVALAVVVALIFGAAWAARRYGGATLLGAGNRIRTLAVANLTQRERVLLLEVNGVQLLVGVASGGVSLLREFAIAPESDTQAGVPPAARRSVAAPASADAAHNSALSFKDAFATALRRALGQSSP